MTSRQLAVVLQAVVFVGRLAAGENGKGCPDREALVQIDGATFTRADLDTRNPALLFQARNAHHEAERKAVEEFVDRYVLEQQAGKEGLTVEQLLKKHVDSSIQKDPSEEALRVYYEGIDTKESFEAVKDKIVEVVRQRRLARAKAAYLQSLRSQANVAIRLPAPRAVIPLTNTPVRGVADAPVMLTEYADYECTYCRQIQPLLERLLSEYKGKLAIAFKDAPLPMHQQAGKAAEAAHCAGAQGKYWEYHDLLFTGGEYSVPKLRETARALKLDAKSFDECLDSGRYAGLVAAQLAEAQSLGVPGTPTFFINGRLLTPGATVSFDTFRQVIEEELRALAERASVLGRKPGGDNGAPAAEAPKPGTAPGKKG